MRSVDFPGLLTPAFEGSICVSTEWSPLLKHFLVAHLPQATCVIDYLLVKFLMLVYIWYVFCVTRKEHTPFFCMVILWIVCGFTWQSFELNYVLVG